MITLETGVPGAGKTLYCVDKLLRALVGATVKHEDSNGEIIELPRTIYTNVNGLLLDHVKIGPGAEWSYDAKSKKWIQDEHGDKNGLNNWHEWAKPGAIIVYDEVQKPWPLAPTGSPVPPCITGLETHRHMGVDFIVLTQHPMLIHANLVRLVGRHLHIRRMGNMGLAIVYEWDTCSRTLLYKNALAKAPYRYDKSVFQLYKSAEVHTKQPRRMPSLVFGVLLALGLIGYFGPASYARIADRIAPGSAPKKYGVEAALAASHPRPPASVPASPVSPPAGFPAPTPVQGGQDQKNAFERPIGCIASASRCQCFDSTGAAMPSITEQQCRDGSHITGYVLVGGSAPPVRPALASSAAVDASAF